MTSTVSCFLLGAIAVLSAASAVWAAPETGIAGKYPGDRGIGKDPDVVFVENFDGGALDRVLKRWEHVKNKSILSISSDVPPGSADRKSLLMTHIGKKSNGAHISRRVLPGYDKLYCRMYVKFDPKCAYIHHFGTKLGGHNPSQKAPGLGGAGTTPSGNKKFISGIEPGGRRWIWDYYTYWMEMRGSPPRGQTWGNRFIRDPSLKVVRGRWICVELMMKMNDPGDRNGEMALWIDGRKVSELRKGFPVGTWTWASFRPGMKRNGIRWSKRARKGVPIPGGKPFEGFRWRSVKKLNINFVCVQLYITKAPAGHVSKVWFDNIVVARKYIGPIKAKTARRTRSNDSGRKRSSPQSHGGTEVRKGK